MHTMKRLLTLTLVVILSTCGLSARDYTHFVNPFVGTDFTGNTYPGAQAPFGMVQLSPDNLIGGWDRIAGYFYPDSTITGFSHTHLDGTGAGDMYDISFMPVTLPYKADWRKPGKDDPNPDAAPLGIYSTFSHADEQASAGYYHVRLADYGIDVTLTATPRVGIQRYIFPRDGKERVVILNLARTMNWDGTTDSALERVDSVNFRGYRFSSGWASDQRVYFATRFSRVPQRVEIDSTAVAGGKGKGLVARFYFGKSSPDASEQTQEDEVQIYTALSGTSLVGASRNLEAETPVDNFPLFLQVARQEWNLHLGVIDADSSNKERARKFYTALYHSMLAPTIYSDVDGAYLGPDRHIHHTEGTHYSTFSLWDTYRAAHPLFTITNPDRVGDMVQSLVDFGEQNGRLPVWNMWGCETDMMIGYHAVPVIADAYLKGFKGFDADRALDICLKTARNKDYRSIGKYLSMGYVPNGVDDMGGNDDWALSRTLEYAYDDWCIATMADAMRYATRSENILNGPRDATKDKRLVAITHEFKSRAKNYENVFDHDRGFMVPRNADGTFEADFNPDKYGPHICESNGWMYLWNVQHDIDGLCRLMGGKKKMLKRLEEFFTHTEEGTEDRPLFSTGMIGQYAHGNEPSHHTAYLFNYLGKPSLCQKYVAQICRELYKDAPDGLCGNEDCGQTSAWFVMSAMGFYPVNPVGGVYEIGTPYLKHYTINLEKNRKVTVSAPLVDDTHIYVKSVKVNGVNYPFSFITDDMLTQNTLIEFEMSDKPCKKWWKSNSTSKQQDLFYTTPYRRDLIEHLVPTVPDANDAPPTMNKRMILE